MFKILVTFFTVIFAFNIAKAKPKETHEHRHHGAHVHGSAKLAIAFESLDGQIEFRAASEGIVGFEYKPQSEKDKKTYADAQAQFQKMDRFVQFDPKLNCQIHPDKIEMVPEKDQDPKEKNHGEHSDFFASYKVRCEKSVVGSKVKFDFTAFEKIHDLDITILAGVVQKSVEAKQKPIEVTIE